MPIEAEVIGPPSLWMFLLKFLPLAIIVSAQFATWITVAVAPFLVEQEQENRSREKVK